jgi:hypothetical protein
MAIVIAVVSVTIPLVVVPDGLMTPAFPVAFKVLLAVVPRAYPQSTFVRRTSPVSVVPGVFPTVGIPVASDENVARAGASRLNPNHPRGGRRSNSNADPKVDGKGAASGE